MMESWTVPDVSFMRTCSMTTLVGVHVDTNSVLHAEHSPSLSRCAWSIRGSMTHKADPRFDRPVLSDVDRDSIRLKVGTDSFSWQTA